MLQFNLQLLLRCSPQEVKKCRLSISTTFGAIYLYFTAHWFHLELRQLQKSTSLAANVSIHTCVGNSSCRPMNRCWDRPVVWCSFFTSVFDFLGGTSREPHEQPRPCLPSNQQGTPFDTTETIVALQSVFWEIEFSQSNCSFRLAPSSRCLSPDQNNYAN